MTMWLFNGGFVKGRGCPTIEMSTTQESVDMPQLTRITREPVGSLCLALEGEESRTGAAHAIRALVEAIVLEPDGDKLRINA